MCRRCARGAGARGGPGAGAASRGPGAGRNRGVRLRVHRRRTGVDHAHDQPLPLRPGVVEHPGRLHQPVDRGSAWPVPPTQRLRVGGRAPGDGPARTGLQVRPRRSRLPQALLRRPPRGPRRPTSLLGRGPSRGDGRHLQRTQHQPHRTRDGDPKLRPRHRLSARRARGGSGHGLATRRVRPRPAVSRHGRRRRPDVVVVGARAVSPVGADGR